MCHRLAVLRGTLVALVLATMVEVAAGQAGRVAGVVRDENGQPIKGATLVLENPEALPRTFTATTDEKGRFGVIGLKSGTWSIQAQAPGYVPEFGEMQVRVAQSPPLILTLSKSLAPPPSVLGSIAANDLQAELRSADQLFNAQQWDQAIGAYKAILARAPALSVINLQVGAAYRNKKDYDSAVNAYNDLLKVNPDNDKAKIGIGLAQVEKGDLRAAEETLNKAAQSPSAGKDVFYNLGEVQFARGNVDGAIASYQQASALDPNWGRPFLKLGLAALNKGDREGAGRMMERVIAVDPTSSEAELAKKALTELRK
jgi:tetratricopeptide (TPR) repeat protein